MRHLSLVAALPPGRIARAATTAADLVELAREAAAAALLVAAAKLHPWSVASDYVQSFGHIPARLVAIGDSPAHVAALLDHNRGTFTSTSVR